ncbi:MAG: DUF4981 domain-containing protein [Clostridia bacterium]|nr:DUF4981 domain-containing protein [Clostridia bacterium]
MTLPNYYENTEILHFNAEPPRAYYIPYANRQEADCGDRACSSYFTDLCGKWKFLYFPSVKEIDCAFYAEDFDSESLPSVPVPGCMQLYECCPDKPLYSNLKYPFPTDPPYVPDENPCAAFIREIDITEEMLKREQYIVFEGVSSCFYLWVNGSFVGYSQVSHCTSEFSLSRFLRQGKNTITVLVLKWCDGSYLEDQDFFRLSGIFREVYLLSRCKNRIDDFQITQAFAGERISASLRIRMKRSAAAQVRYRLLSPAFDIISSGATDQTDFSIDIPRENMYLWSDESPLLYSLYLECGDETIKSCVALCEKKINNGKLLLNGKPVRLRGINRHDSTENGYVVSVADMHRDLSLLKKANVNTIRTSHYPNDPRFVELCERYGFYLVDEADLETHGMGFNTDSDWDWMRWSLLSSLPSWKNAYVDRASRLYERDKNSGCVIMWSLGNESGCGVNHRAMREYIKSKDPSAVVHYENAHLAFKAVPEGEDFSDISDVESRMYADVNYIESYLNNPAYKKPFFMCEYVCSMSTGDVYDYWRFADEYDHFCGGCIWEFADHAVCIPDKNGRKRYYYGGDFGDFPNDGICCIDGLVFPDRSLRPGYYDMKKVYEPFRGRFENGYLHLKNIRSFTAFDDLYLSWQVTCGAEIVKEGTVDLSGIAPGEEKSFCLFHPEQIQIGENCFLTARICRKEDSPWARAGEEIGFLQYELTGYCQVERAKAENNKITTEEDDRFVRIICGVNEYVFDKVYGRIDSIQRNGSELLTMPQRFTIWRAPCYNRGSADAWIANHFDHIRQKTYACSVQCEENEVTISCDISLCAPSNPPVVRMRAEYIFSSDGCFTISVQGTVRENAPVLPRLGIEFSLKKEYDKIRYFGLGGTGETYPDRYKAARFGEYELSAEDNFIHYIRPQENGAHDKTRRVDVGRMNGPGLRATRIDAEREFSFNASRFSSEQTAATKHDFELIPEERTILTVDWRQNAISENRLLEHSGNRRLLDDKQFSFGFAFEPIDF